MRREVQKLKKGLPANFRRTMGDWSALADDFRTLLMTSGGPEPIFQQLQPESLARSGRLFAINDAM
jgi:hypothetical protein